MRLKFAHWKRFSLRTLFVLMTLLCVVFGIFAAYVSPYRQQLQAAAFVHRHNGKTGSIEAAGPRWQRWLVTTFLGERAFERVVEVDLIGRDINDKDLQSLAGLKHLQSLWLDYTPITDDGLAVTRSMPNLKDVSLKFTKITDRGIAQLSTLQELQHLALTGTKVSDAAVDDLSKLTTLKTIFIRWTGLTDSGASRLRTALPYCEIHHHALSNKALAIQAP